MNFPSNSICDFFCQFWSKHSWNFVLWKDTNHLSVNVFAMLASFGLTYKGRTQCFSDSPFSSFELHSNCSPLFNITTCRMMCFILVDLRATAALKHLTLKCETGWFLKGWTWSSCSAGGGCQSCSGSVQRPGIETPKSLHLPVCDGLIWSYL